MEEGQNQSKIEEIRPIRYISPARNTSKYKLQPNSKFQSPLRKSNVYTGNLYTPRKYKARSLSENIKYKAPSLLFN